MNELKIHFDGPFTFSDNYNSVFKCKYKSSSGIYLWVIKTKLGNLIHYIGETSNFAKRHKEHLINILGFNYGIFDPQKAKEGKNVLLWKGLWREKSDNFVDSLFCNYANLNFIVKEYINCIDIYFAELKIEKDLRKHIEGSIGSNLRNNYQEYKVLYPDDNHIGVKDKKLNIKLLISSSENILGLDKEIII